MCATIAVIPGCKKFRARLCFLQLVRLSLSCTLPFLTFLVLPGLGSGRKAIQRQLRWRGAMTGPENEIVFLLSLAWTVLD